MNTYDEQARDRDLDELLPWYVNGRLNPQERERVESYLDRCPPARAEVETLRALRRNLKEDSFPAPPGELGLARLKRDIREMKAQPVPVPATVRPVVSPLWKAAAIAACLLAVVQGGILVDLWVGGDLTTASAPGPGAAVIQVRFVSTAKEADIRAALRAARVTIVSGPSSLGVYRLALVEKTEGAKAHEASIAAAIAALAARGEIVAEVAAEHPADQ